MNSLHLSWTLAASTVARLLNPGEGRLLCVATVPEYGSQLEMASIVTEAVRELVEDTASAIDLEYDDFALGLAVYQLVDTARGSGSYEGNKIGFSASEENVLLIVTGDEASNL